MPGVALRDAAQGRWRGILPALGIEGRYLTGKHGPCPICSAGRDRFRFDDKEGRGTWICSACGAGDGIALVMRKRGLDFKAAAAEIEPLVDTAPVSPNRPQQSPSSKRAALNRAWAGARLIEMSDAAGLYLSRRLGLVSFPSALRFQEATQYKHDDGRVTYHPAMLARIVGPSASPATLHRTYLTEAGEKIDFAEPRKLMPAPESLPAGAAVRLGEAGNTLGIAEGIETALAASDLFSMPVWAAVNAGMMAKWMPPAGTRRVIIFGDNDATYRGQSAAYALAHSLTARRLVDEVEVRIPPQIGTDWDDVRREQQCRV